VQGVGNYYLIYLVYFDTSILFYFCPLHPPQETTGFVEDMGRAAMPLAGAAGAVLVGLWPGARWNLLDPHSPEWCIPPKSTRLLPGQLCGSVPPHISAQLRTTAFSCIFPMSPHAFRTFNYFRSQINCIFFPPRRCAENVTAKSQVSKNSPFYFFAALLHAAEFFLRHSILIKAMFDSVIF